MNGDDMTTNPLLLQEDLTGAYLRYVDTAYWLRDQRLVDERRGLLESAGALRSECLLEPVLPYDATADLLAATRTAAIADSVADSVGRALFGDFIAPDQPVLLREHQAEAVRQHFQPGVADGRHVVVTSGTGSGKTEKLPASGAATPGERGGHLVQPTGCQAVVDLPARNAEVDASTPARDATGRRKGAHPLSHQRSGRGPDDKASQGGATAGSLVA